jgi:sugar (pentulose or hexulose) kinase
MWADVASACKACVKITGSTQPEPSQVEAYRKAYPLYQELYPALKSSLHKME